MILPRSLLALRPVVFFVWIGLTDLSSAVGRDLPGNHLRGIMLLIRGEDGVLPTTYFSGRVTPSACRISFCRPSGRGSRVTVVFSSTAYSNKHRRLSAAIASPSVMA